MNAILTAAVERTDAARLRGSPFWLELGREHVYGLLHEPEAGSGSDTAALLLPPFGWDNDCSYRSRREWATALARAGITAARIDLPGSENSSGAPTDPGLVSTWVDATVAAALWLRRRSRCERLVAIGIGLGGTIAHQATAAGGPIDDLILWGVHARGRAHVREMMTFASVLADGIDATADPARADGAVGIGGHLISAETMAALSAIDLAATALPHARRRRVLLVARDAHGVDQRLARQLEQSGAMVTVLAASDYHRLMAPAELDMTPHATIAASVEWLRERTAGDPEPPAHAPARDAHAPRAGVERDCVELELGGVRIREHARELETEGGRLIGVISEPASAPRAPYCLVVLNCAAMRNTSPSRLFVQIARRAAADGIPVARFDLPGLGDSDGEVASVLERRLDHDADSMAALNGIYDQLQRWGFGDRFVGIGLCLGGYLTVRAILSDARTVGGIAINAPAFTWTDTQTHRVLRDHAAFVGAELTAARLEQAPAGGPLRELRERVAQAGYRAEARASRRLVAVTPLWRLKYRAGIADVSRDLDRIGGTGAQLWLLLSEDEALHRMLALPRPARKLARWPNIRVRALPTRDHVLRPLWIQALVLEQVSLALRELSATIEAET